MPKPYDLLWRQPRLRQRWSRAGVRWVGCRRRLSANPRAAKPRQRVVRVSECGPPVDQLLAVGLRDGDVLLHLLAQFGRARNQDRLRVSLGYVYRFVADAPAQPSRIEEAEAKFAARHPYPQEHVSEHAVGGNDVGHAHPAEIQQAHFELLRL